jgi:hypothetical protein
VLDSQGQRISCCTKPPEFQGMTTHKEKEQAANRTFGMLQDTLFAHVGDLMMLKPTVNLSDIFQYTKGEVQQKQNNQMSMLKMCNQCLALHTNESSRWAVRSQYRNCWACMKHMTKASGDSVHHQQGCLNPGWVCTECTGLTLSKEGSGERAKILHWLNQVLVKPLVYINPDLDVVLSEKEPTLRDAGEITGFMDAWMWVTRKSTNVKLMGFGIEIDPDQHRDTNNANGIADEHNRIDACFTFMRDAVGGPFVPLVLFRVNVRGNVNVKNPENPDKLLTKKVDALDTWLTVREWLVALIRGLAVPIMELQLPKDTIIYINYNEDDDNPNIYTRVPWIVTSSAPKLAHTSSGPDWACSHNPRFLAEWQGLGFADLRVTVAEALHKTEDAHNPKHRGDGRKHFR